MPGCPVGGSAADFLGQPLGTIVGAIDNGDQGPFAVRGMGHGVGTTGAENFNVDTLALIEQWKQTGQPPNQLIAAHYKDGKEVGRRLVCQYPRIAFYKGSGNTEDPASYECR